ncbi:hypothetical protein, partial [Xylella fastidiosa]|uniref:hypothetical protein n=1 Tax=Xylella fastidiosa TaxID=2371 RepID=UPI0019310077
LRDQKLAEEVDFSMFDVLIYHYAVRLSWKDYLPEPMARKIERFTGLKLLFIQDEYDTTNTARRRDAGVDDVERKPPYPRARRVR